MKKILFFTIALLIFFSLNFNNNVKTANADTFSETINEQLDKLDFSDLEEHFKSLKIDDYNFYSLVTNLINGNNTTNVNGIFDYVANSLLGNATKNLPTFLTIISICIFCALIGELKSSFLEDSISQTIYFVCFLCVLSLISVELISIYQNTINIIKNITKTCEIMSPIMLTLMVVSGQNSSIALYNPVVVFLSNGLLNLITNLILPIILLYGVFSIINNLSGSVKLNRFIEFISSLLKWMLGLSVTIFGVYLTTNGIATATFDGVSVKLANYAITNSIPIVGGFVKDGFNVILAGSHLIKNAVGISGLIGLFYVILSPVISMICYSLLLKFTAGVLEPFNLNGVSQLCTSASKFITYLIISILIVGVMAFITILLMIYASVI